MAILKIISLAADVAFQIILEILFLLASVLLIALTVDFNWGVFKDLRGDADDKS